jgi:hypothetical protein
LTLPQLIALSSNNAPQIVDISLCSDPNYINHRVLCVLWKLDEVPGVGADCFALRVSRFALALRLNLPYYVSISNSKSNLALIPDICVILSPWYRVRDKSNLSISESNGHQRRETLN